MMSLRGTRLLDLRPELATVWLQETIAESKGRQALYERQSPQIVAALREMAMIESAESSNRIEGVTAHKDRLRPLVLGNARPRDRSEADIVGYRRALDWIHTDHERIEITAETFQRLHSLAQADSSDAGQWKSRPNDIIEVLPDGRRFVRFRPLPPAEVPTAVEELCLAYHHLVDQSTAPPLLLVACLVLDMLCIHPFRDGNGRVSRLLTLLALYHHGHRIGRYISLERVVEQTKEAYYDVLQRSSARWHEAHHDVLPWFNYFLTTLRSAYREFEERAGRERPTRGSKTDLAAYALENVLSPFGIADVERLCPSVSRETIRLVMNRWRRAGRLEIIARGRDAKWRRV
ncbi:MAG TPA: Fic family protein [Methylomirabilota bacterium]|nr:Fic family protein [Methylomirabilota bacterium]